MNEIEAYLLKVQAEESPIQEHLETLRRLAHECERVTEFGAGLSTVALLAGQPERLDSYDLVPYEVIRIISPMAGRTRFTFHEENTLTARIDPTDMLFIDTKHTAEQVYTELKNNAHRVRKWLVFHDTVTCGECDPLWPGPPAGLLYGIGRFMHEQDGKWRLWAHFENCNGLTVYERV